MSPPGDKYHLPAQNILRGAALGLQTKNPTVLRAVGCSDHQQLLLGDVGGCRSFGTINDFKLNLVSFVQRLKTASGDGGIVYKHILSFFLLDETKPLGLVKPFDCSFQHRCLVLLLCDWISYHVELVLQFKRNDLQKRYKHRNHMDHLTAQYHP